jgi:pimeloyl-ACP methyl ester carboxylesterase
VRRWFRNLAIRAGAAACAALALSAWSSRVAAQGVRQQADAWRDVAKHSTGMVTVERGVRLHYLDFGGRGPTLLFLPGLGNTAHAFDDFAPRFTDQYHVVALTRRGFGESDHPTDGYDIPRLVEDIRQAMDRLQLGKVTLIGHSIAGEEMTRFAATYPDRVTSLVYLDAAYDRIAADSAIQEVFQTPPNVPGPPTPLAADTATPSAYVDFVHRTRGVNIPESDIRTRYRYDGWQEEITLAYQSIEPERPNYSAIRVPALAIYAVADSVSQLEPWQRSDTANAAGYQDLLRGMETAERPLREQFKREVSRSRVVEIHGGHHWIFVSHADRVFGAVRDFLAAPESRPVR